MGHSVQLGINSFFFIFIGTEEKLYKMAAQKMRKLHFNLGEIN